MTLPRFIRTRQPQQPVGIDWSNPITRGLVSCVDKDGREFVSGDSLVKTGDLTAKPTAKGLAIGSAGSAYFSRASFNNVAPTNTAFTVAGTVALGSTSQTNKYLAYQANSGGFNQASVIFGYVSGNIEFYVAGFTGDSPRTGSQIPIADTQPHTFAYSYDGVNWVGYLDGVVAFETTRTFNINLTTVTEGALLSAGNSNIADAYLLGWSTFNRGLSKPELRELTANPWQIFQPTNRAIWIPVSVSTSATVSGALTTENSTVSASASVSPVASTSITAAASTITGSASVPSEVSGALSTAAASVAANASVSPVATASITTGASTFSGSASSGSSVASMSITTEDAFAAAVASVSPVALMSAYTDDATVSGSAQGQVTGVYPDPATVLAGVVYGPSGSDYTGTLEWSSAADIATAVLLRFQATVIPVNLTQVRGQTIGGSGTANDPWGP